MKQLRPYQVEAHAAVFDAMMNDYKRILYTAATGTGKTVTFAALILSFINVYDWPGLVLANRKELIDQAYREIRDACGLDEYQIDKEMGASHFSRSAKVVVGSVQTCHSDTRLFGWTPKYIIADEAHYAAAETWQKVFKRFPDAIVIGCTATALRGDNQQLYAIANNKPKQGTDFVLTEEGYRITVEDRKTKETRPVELSETVFDILVSEYEVLDAIEDGYLVELEKEVVLTDFDLSGVKVKRGKDGDIDFVASEVKAVLEASIEDICTRINLAISRWRRKASDRPTIVFAPSVEYAQWAAELWWKAGFKSQAVDAETDTRIYDPERPWIPAGMGARQRALEDVRSGKIQVTCNVGLYTHGTDVDVWSCAVMLKPTRSWPLYCQMGGRTTRPLSAIAKLISAMSDAAERRECIARSLKPNALIIDVVDKNKKNNPCSAPAILGLPCDFDFEGKKMTDVKKLLNDYAEEEGLGRVLGTCPMNLTDLKFRLEHIDLMKRSQPRSMDKWRVTERGYTFVGVPPGFHAEIVPQGAQWQTVVSHKGVEVARKPGPIRTDNPQSFRAYQDTAASQVSRVIDEYRGTLAPVRRGTLDWLKTWRGGGRNELNALRRANFTDVQIDAMGKTQVQAVLKSIRDKMLANRSKVA